MRPEICVPLTAPMRDGLTAQAREAAALPAEMAEWRVDCYAGYEEELPDIVRELKKILGEKKLIVTLRTEKEGGEPNGSRFDYFALIDKVIGQNIADYVDVEIDREGADVAGRKARFPESRVKVIGSYHDFSGTPSGEKILEKLTRAKESGCDVGKLACMPSEEADVERLLDATARMKKLAPDFPLITMSMGELGKKSRLYGGLYGSSVSFGSAGQTSAPGQLPIAVMKNVFDRIYSGKRHIVLIGFMGVGKSTVSAELRVLSGREEVDTDRWIEEKEGRSIADIFEEEGEAYFRDRETEMIDELGGLAPAVISCGGGMALRELNVRKLQAIGTVVLLRAEPETVFERVRHSTDRPLLRDNMNVAYIRQLMEKRRPFYEAAAEVQIFTDGRPASDIAKEILEKCR